MTVLDDIVANKRLEIARRKEAAPTDVLAGQATPLATPRFERALKASPEDHHLQLILEIKPASPSAGVLQSNLDLPAVLDAYHQAGSAISVLTDETYFRGSLDLLAQVRERSPLPVLCKDFILDAHQVVEARLAGADAVLLMAKILADDELQRLYNTVVEWGMTPLVEIQNPEELERALKLRPKAVLVNNRNLETFKITLDTSLKLMPHLPPEVIGISASGIESRRDIEYLLPVCHRFLIGSMLMRTPVSHLPRVLRELQGR